MRIIKLVLSLILAIVQGDTVQLEGTLRGAASLGLLAFTIRQRAVALAFTEYRPGRVYYRLEVAA